MSVSATTVIRAVYLDRPAPT